MTLNLTLISKIFARLIKAAFIWSKIQLQITMFKLFVCLFILQIVKIGLKWTLFSLLRAKSNSLETSALETPLH